MNDVKKAVLSLTEQLYCVWKTTRLLPLLI